MIPKDPVMLLSYINLKLRDYYSNLDIACSELDINKTDVEEKLAEIGYFYDKEYNQFL